MARMFPEHGPASGTTSKAEKRIYALLAEALGDEYAIFHGLRWETREHDDRLVRRESDFLVIAPAHGLLIVEAKGGHIRRADASGRYWTKASSGRAKRPTRDPFEQARSLVPLMERHLWTAPLTRPYAPGYRVGYAVWFPDTEWKRGAGAEAEDDALVLDRRDLEAPEAGLLRAFASFERDGVPPPLPEEALAALVQTLAPTVKVQSRLAVQIVGERRRIDELTAEQFEILQALGRYRRLAVSGAAGTGKTVLAYEKARRLAAQGLDTLLLCSNPSLAAWLRSRAESEPVELKGHLTIQDVGALCAWALARAGTLRDDGGRAAEAPAHGAGGLTSAGIRRRARLAVPEMDHSERPEALAELLAAAVRTLGRRDERMPFDAILVDEAQDIERPLWEPILALLRDRADGLCYVFYDEAQREAEGGWRPPLPGEKGLVPLVVNLRNTRAIFEVMMRFYRGPDTPICRGPEGRPVMYLDPATLPLPAPPATPRPATSPPAREGDGDSERAGEDGRAGEGGRAQDAPPKREAEPSGVADDAEREASSLTPTDAESVASAPTPADAEVYALRLALDHLVDAEGILPEDILVITCRSQKRSRWYTAEQRQIGKHRLIQRPEGGRPGRVALSTVRSAKGLERKVVILTELDGLDEAARDHSRRDALLYVALSRAAHHLVVLGPEKALQPRKGGVLALIRGR